MDIYDDGEVLYEYSRPAADDVEEASMGDSQMHITPCMDTVNCMMRASERTEEATTPSKASRASQAIEANECLLHSKHLRSQLQQLLNLTFHFFRRRFHTRIMKYVCNCETSKSQVLDCIAAYTADDLDNVRMLLGAMSSPKLDAVLAQLLVIGARNSSLWRLHELFIRAAADDYELLKSAAEKKKKQVPFRLTVQADMPHKVTSFFIGKGGNKICALQEKLGIKILLVTNAQADYVKDYEQRRQLPRLPPLLDLTGSDRDKVFSTLNAIQEVCQRMAEKRKRHDDEQLYKDKWSFFIKYGLWDISSDDDEDIIETKETLKLKYESHYKQAKSGNTYRRAKKPRVLEGTCLNCLQTYKLQQNYDGACRYHSGYQRNNGRASWTCCGNESTNKVSSGKWSLMSMHATFGCCSGRHFGRPHGNRKHSWKGSRLKKTRF